MTTLRRRHIVWRGPVSAVARCVDRHSVKKAGRSTHAIETPRRGTEKNVHTPEGTQAAAETTAHHENSKEPVFDVPKPKAGIKKQTPVVKTQKLL